MDRGNDRGGDRGYGGQQRGYRNDHGGGYGGGNRQRGNEPMHQRSYVGKKRGRGDEEIEDPKKLFIQKLMNLGDGVIGHGSQEGLLAVVEEGMKLCKRELMHRAHSVGSLVALLLECATELSTKTPIYAMLLGLLNVEDVEVGKSLLSQLSAGLASSLAAPQPADHDQAKLLLRLLGCLTRVNVLHPSAAIHVLEGLVANALAVAKSGSDPSGHSWQPWTDWLVYLVLASLPWSAAELSAACPAELTRLMDAVEEYMGCRPIQHYQELRPFLTGVKDDDVAARSDSGGASFLPELWAAIQACAADSWQVAAIPSLLDNSTMEGRLAVALPHDLPPVTLPDAPPQPPAHVLGQDDSMMGEAPTRAVQAAYLRQCYPPRGGIRLLSSEVVDGDRPAIERFIAEEYILDTLAAFDGNRKQCIRVLSSGLPLSWSYAPLLGEVLFGQMLALPQSRLPLMAYTTIIVDLCKLPRLEFPRVLSGLIRECFARVGVCDPELPPRLVDFLSCHLSNYEYQWPWHKWEHHADSPPDNPQRQFCQHLVHRLVRLSYWERIHKLLPEKFQSLLGPAPSTPTLPGESQPQAAPAPPPPPAATDAPPAGEQLGDGGMVVETEVLPGTDADAAAGGQMEGVEAAGGAAQVSVLDQLSGAVLKEVRAKTGWEALLAWMGAQGVEAQMGAGPEGSLQVLMRALLAAGSKSPSHLNVAIERYAPALSQLLDSCSDHEAGQQVLLKEAAAFYSMLPQKVLMVVDRLLAQHLVSAAGVATWVTTWALAGAAPDAAGTTEPDGAGGVGAGSQAEASAWEVLWYVLDRVIRRPAELKEKIHNMVEERDAQQERADELTRQAERMWAQLREHVDEVRGVARAAQAGAEGMAVDGAGDGQGGGGGADGASEAGAGQGAEKEKQGAGGEAGAGDVQGVQGSAAALDDPELEAVAQQDVKGRRLLDAARQSNMRAQSYLDKAASFSTSVDQLTLIQQECATAPTEALLTAFKGLAHLVTQHEKQVEQAEQGGAGQDEAMQDTAGAGSSTSGPKHQLERLYAQVAAFARRYSVVCATSAAQLQQTLQQAGASDRLVSTIMAVLHVSPA